MRTASFTVPHHLPSLPNSRENRWDFAKIKKSQHGLGFAAGLSCRARLGSQVVAAEVRAARAKSIRVIFTRVGPKKLDDDNVTGAFKYVRDGVAEALGADDGARVYEFKYRQRTGAYAVEVEITLKNAPERVQAKAI